MHQIIFFDIDGTLRDEVYGVPETAKVAIKMCRENSIYTCLCTGRTIGTITDDVLDLSTDGIIAGGGSYIEFQSEVIKKTFFKMDKMKEASFYLKNMNNETAFTFESDDIVFMNKAAVEILTSLNNEKFKLLNEEERRGAILKQKIIYEENLHSFNENLHEISKICLWGSEEVFKKLKSIFSENEIQLAQSYKFDSRNYYEIIQKECNKGEAILSLCKHLDIDVNKTLGFGDGRNDIDMLKVVGSAVGVQGGSKEIFQYVDSICEEPMKDGIYLELKRRNLI
ncbi:Cof-type HAD-IIB family hydrolase [Clostridium sp.]|uniref:Cof-type HAD-IIB family hydrolase n=1 Tax=Clostridium sp. TaxID=1506 RepID=UPI001ED0C5BC|nr:Cof-type HAD-IIB family hydrolase [Clostridium sp.]MBS5884071.1 Cof-type HAD-IIB family hydrolase [Clostridium sp.]